MDKKYFMKILHVSNFGDKHNARLYWNQCFKITNGFTRNGHSVYNFSDRDRSRASIFNKINNNVGAIFLIFNKNHHL